MRPRPTPLLEPEFAMRTRFGRRLIPLAVALALVACGEGEGPEPPEGDAGAGIPSIGPAPPAAEMAASAAVQEQFLEALRSLCGRAFRGESTLSTSDAFADGLIMHVRVCEEDEIQIPLHAGENRSRTWIVTRTADGLRLKHDHRLEDGSDDPVTQYGGDTVEPGTPTQQSFPADAFTAELIPAAATNVWTMTIFPGERFVYHLTRDAAPRATFEFDLTDEVEPPPPPWGYEGS